MSELTLDSAIKHCLDVAEQNETFSNQLSYQLEDIGKKLFMSLEDAENALNNSRVFPKRREKH